MEKSRGINKYSTLGVSRVQSYNRIQRRKRRELEESEKKLETNRSAAELEMKERQRHAGETGDGTWTQKKKIPWRQVMTIRKHWQRRDW